MIDPEIKVLPGRPRHCLRGRRAQSSPAAELAAERGRSSPSPCPAAARPSAVRAARYRRSTKSGSTGRRSKSSSATSDASRPTIRTATTAWPARRCCPRSPSPATTSTACAAKSTPNEAARQYGQMLKEKFGDGGLDLVLLGMGDDGHTASLFPGTAALTRPSTAPSPTTSRSSRRGGSPSPRRSSTAPGSADPRQRGLQGARLSEVLEGPATRSGCRSSSLAPPRPDSLAGGRRRGGDAEDSRVRPVGIASHPSAGGSDCRMTPEPALAKSRGYSLDCAACPGRVPADAWARRVRTGK